MLEQIMKLFAPKKKPTVVAPKSATQATLAQRITSAPSPDVLDVRGVPLERQVNHPLVVSQQLEKLGMPRGYLEGGVFVDDTGFIPTQGRYNPHR